MRYLFFALLIFIQSFSVQGQTLKLPVSCEKILSEKFKSWKPAVVKPEIVEFLKERNELFAPNLIKGDWNDDNKIDYAVLISKGKETKTIAFIADAQDYKHHELTGGDFISLNKKSSRAFDHNRKKSFIFERDSITVVFWEKGADSFIWRKKGFVAIITSD